MKSKYLGFLYPIVLILIFVLEYSGTKNINVSAINFKLSVFIYFIAQTLCCTLVARVVIKRDSTTRWMMFVPFAQEVAIMNSTTSKVIVSISYAVAVLSTGLTLIPATFWLTLGMPLSFPTTFLVQMQYMIVISLLIETAVFAINLNMQTMSRFVAPSASPVYKITTSIGKILSMILLFIPALRLTAMVAISVNLNNPDYVPTTHRKSRSNR